MEMQLVLEAYAERLTARVGRIQTFIGAYASFQKFNDVVC